MSHVYRHRRHHLAGEPRKSQAAGPRPGLLDHQAPVPRHLCLLLPVPCLSLPAFLPGAHLRLEGGEVTEARAEQLWGGCLRTPHSASSVSTCCVPGREPGKALFWGVRVLVKQFTFQGAWNSRRSTAQGAGLAAWPGALSALAGVIRCLANGLEHPTDNRRFLALCSFKNVGVSLSVREH